LVDGKSRADAPSALLVPRLEYDIQLISNFFTANSDGSCFSFLMKCFSLERVQPNPKKGGLYFNFICAGQERCALMYQELELDSIN
jgi:hypothetical protein